MSVQLIGPSAIFECSMCPETQVGVSWRSLATKGWTSNPAKGYAPIILCPPCAEIIANRRGAAHEAR